SKDLAGVAIGIVVVLINIVIAGPSYHWSFHESCKEFSPCHSLRFLQKYLGLHHRPYTRSNLSKHGIHVLKGPPTNKTIRPH
ncbi:hypothetical protein HN51_051740, partial [Arachis hypogaea]